MTQTRPRSTSSTILVTGPTGKVGRRLIPLLARRGLTIRTASRSPAAARAGIEPVRFDWTDESTYETARKGVDAMYLVAGPIPQPEHADYIRALLDSVTGVERVVLLSTYGLDQAPPENPLRRIELAVESSGVPYTILRPVAFMQNFSEWHPHNVAESIRERDEIVHPGGNGLMSYVSAEDIAAVAAIALTEDGHNGKAYAPLGPEPLTLMQVAEQISWVAGRRIRYVETDHTPMRDALLAAGTPLETAEHNSRLHAYAFSSGVMGVLNDDVLNVTGRPPVSFGEFAVGAAAAWRRSAPGSAVKSGQKPAPNLKNARIAQSPILVVGATGTVGSELVKQLAAAGHRSRALVRNSDKAQAIASFATPVIGDLSTPESLLPAFTGAERVFILAPPTLELETLERNAFDAAITAGAKRIVFLSNYGAAEFDDDPHFHVHGKHERHLASLGVDWTVLRPTRFMNYTPFVWSSITQRGLLIEAGGAGAITVIDPTDIAAVALKALAEDGHEGRSYDLTSEDSFTADELARMLSRILQRDITIFKGDFDALRTALIESGAPAEYASLMAAYFTKVAAGFFKTTDTVRKVLGRAPRFYADWLEQNHPAA